MLLWPQKQQNDSETSETVRRNQMSDGNDTSDLDVLGEDQMVRKYIYVHV